MIRLLVTTAAVLTAIPAYAQSSLGIRGADLSFGAAQDEFGTAQYELDGSVDVAVTEYHGLQGDLAFYNTDGGLVGQLGAHLYMTPKIGQKYGVFASVSDVDGRSMVWGNLGVEGMLSLGEASVVEGRVGLGVSDVNGLDYIFGGVSITHEISSSLEIEASLEVAEFDEASFSAVSYEAGLTARYNRDGSPLGAYASVTFSDMTGRDGQPAETRISVGLTVALGTTGGVDPATRPFRRTDPVAPLVRRGLW
ncbi:MAG: hypothetical protein OXQ92_18140 [Boseongicola sp.]|nr:hypothetical protein [Boseongicola sp.]MDD9978953.1 hypothetical protein [Boseongicola sp.]